MRTSGLVAVLLLLVAAGFAGLGRWQLDRAEQNRALEEQYATAGRLPPLEAPIRAAELASLRFRRIELQGRYLDGPQVLLDNRVHGGRAGFEVLTPFRVADSDALVLVNRGWVESTGDRTRLPRVPIAPVATTIRGRIDRLPSAAISLDAELPLSGSAALFVLSYPSFEDLETVLAMPLHRFQLVLEPASDQSLVPSEGAPSSLHERNLAYAVQWFGLAVTALAISVGIFVRTRRSLDRSGPSA